MSTKVAIWNEFITASSDRMPITLIRFLDDEVIKPRLCLLSQVTAKSNCRSKECSSNSRLSVSIMQVMSVLSVTTQTAREVIDRLGMKTGTIREAKIIRRLRSLAALSINTAQVSVIRLSDAVKLWKHYQVSDVLLDGLIALRSAQPPPQTHVLGQAASPPDSSITPSKGLHMYALPFLCT